jgi:hypothetical protein
MASSASAVVACAFAVCVLSDALNCRSGIEEPEWSIRPWRCFGVIQRFAEFGKELFAAPQCVAVTLHFAVPLVGFGVRDELDLTLASCAQAWRVLPGRDELRTAEVQVGLAWPPTTHRPWWFGAALRHLLRIASIDGQRNRSGRAHIGRARIRSNQSGMKFAKSTACSTSGARASSAALETTTVGTLVHPRDACEKYTVCLSPCGPGCSTSWAAAGVVRLIVSATPKQCALRPGATSEGLQGSPHGPTKTSRDSIRGNAPRSLASRGTPLRRARGFLARWWVFWPAARSPEATVHLACQGVPCLSCRRHQRHRPLRRQATRD